MDFFPKKLIVSKFSSADAAIYAAQELIHYLQNSASAKPLITLGDVCTAALRSLAVIFNNATPRARPPRVVPI